jgi:hypothetical protein
VSPPPLPDEKVRVLQDHLGKLRLETEGWLERQARVWQTAIAGIAAIFVLKEDANIEVFLPLAPILGVAVVAQWLNLVLMVWRAGWAMAVDEHRLNGLVGGPDLLTHEKRLWGERSARVRKLAERKGLIILGVLLAGVGYGAVLWWILETAAFDVAAAKAIYGAAAAVVYALAVWNLLRIVRLEDYTGPEDEAEQGS